MIDEIWERLKERGIEATIIVAESLTKFGRGNNWYRNGTLEGFSIASAMDFIIPRD